MAEIGAARVVPVHGIVVIGFNPFLSRFVVKMFLSFLIVSFLVFAACVDSGSRNEGIGSSGTDIMECVHEAFTRHAPLIFDFEKSIGAYSADTFLLNSITDSVRFVPLETNLESVFQNYNYRLSATTDGFYISGGITRSSGVLEFDTSGKFKGNVVHTGRGPDEVSMAIFWTVHEALRKICVIGLSQKMVVRWLGSGMYSSSLLKGSLSPQIIPLGDGSYVCTKSSGLGKQGADVPYLSFMDSTGNIIYSVSDIRKRDVHYEIIEGKLNHPFDYHMLTASYKGGALFKDVYNDTLYYIQDYNHIAPYVVFLRGKFFPEIKDVYDDDRKAMQVYFRDMMETGRYFFIKYFYSKQLFTDIWDKRSLKLVSRFGKEAETAMIDKFHARYVLPNGEETTINILFANKNQLYCLLEAPVASRFMNQIDEEDNPVVMILNLK